MEFPIIFEPLTNPLFGSISLSIVTVVLSLAGIVFFTKNRTIERIYRHLFSMLCFFGLMMSLGAAMFGWFFGERVGEVVIQKDRFETPYGELEYDMVKDIVIKRELATNSMLSPQLSGNYVNKILLFTETGERFTFSENNYPVREMIKPMRDTWEKVKQKK